MSKRPGPTPSRPHGSTHANTTKGLAHKLARYKRYNLSPFPRSIKKGSYQFTTLKKKR